MTSALLVLVAAMVSSSLSSKAIAAIKVQGAVIDDSAKKIGEDRFKSSEDWEKTLRFFKGVYGGKPGIVWSTIETPPKVKAIHIANTLPKRTWEGINIYETGGDIFIYVIKAEATSSPAKETKTKSRG